MFWVTQQQLKGTKLFLLRPGAQFCFGSQVKSATKTAVSWLCRMLTTPTEGLCSNSSAKMFINDKKIPTHQRIHLSAVSVNRLDYHVKACNGTETGAMNRDFNTVSVVPQAITTLSSSQNKPVYQNETLYFSTILTNVMKHGRSLYRIPVPVTISFTPSLSR